MILEDQHFKYPEDMKPSEVISRIDQVLKAATANRDVWNDERMDWENLIHRECWFRGVHPIWPLVSLQRERSLLGRAGGIRDFDFAEGVVGQDKPGSVNETWNGLPTQLLLSIRTAAWLGGIGPRANFGYRIGLWPSAARWDALQQGGGVGPVQLYNDQHESSGFHQAKTMAEYIQLKFTPHLEVLETNGGIFEARIASFFE